MAILADHETVSRAEYYTRYGLIRYGHTGLRKGRWTADNRLYATSALSNFDMRAYYENWLRAMWAARRDYPTMAAWLNKLEAPSAPPGIAAKASPSATGVEPTDGVAPSD